MKCPTCGKSLCRMDVGGVGVDVCEAGCGGMWFDSCELQKFDEPRYCQSEGEVLLDRAMTQSTQCDHTGDRYCPKCCKTTMMKHVRNSEYQVEVDECPECGGIWMDCGQLAYIRTQGHDETQCRKATESYYKDLFGTSLSPWCSGSDEKMGTARRLANMFRFLCPTSCAPKEQMWQQWWPYWS